MFFVSSYHYMTFRVLWDHFTPFHCLASTEAGTLHYIDVRKVSVNTQHFIRAEWHQEWLLSFQATTPLWTLSAHTEAVTGISMSPHCPGVVSTVSQDKMLKVYCNLSSSCISGHHHHPKILISCLQHFLRSGTSRGPSQPLLVSAPLVLAPFTPFPTVLMCLSSLQLEETKPATISRYDCFFQNCRVCSDHT